MIKLGNTNYATKHGNMNAKQIIKHNRVVLVATKFYEAVEKEETPAPQESKTKKGK